MKNIVLIGIMGCGKTTVAKRLSSELGWPFVDTDALIEKTYGPIPKLFEKGEGFFRDAESRIVSQIASLDGTIISTGGGVVLREENVKALKKNGVLIFIDRPVRLIAESIDCSGRPLLKDGPGALYKLAERRYPLYQACCDYHVVSNKDVSHTVRAIMEILKKDGFINC